MATEAKQRQTRNIHGNGREWRKCRVCGKAYQRDPYGPSSYCSRKCRFAPGQRRVNLVGQVFGPWEVIAFDEQRSLYGKGKRGLPRLVNHWKIRCVICARTATMQGANLKTFAVHCKGCAGCKGRPKGYAGLFSLYRRYCYSTKKTNRAFGLTLDEFQILTSSACHYCGKAPSMIEKPSQQEWGFYAFNGVDRKDNTKDYTSENCVPCCMDCNFAKRDTTYDAFCSYIRLIAENAAHGRVPCLNSSTS